MSVVLIFLSALIAMAFYTLLERKILGYSQLRKGPNKVSFLGILQPVSDAMKLMFKMFFMMFFMNFNLMFMMAIMMIMLSFLFWLMYNSVKMYIIMGLFMFLLLSSLAVYPILLSGWSSNSKYASLGGYRGMAQTISYEVSLIFLIMGPIMMMGKLEVLRMKMMLPFFFSLSLFMMCWIFSFLAETNRSPFDFSEGESELVSGFNTEYSGVGFMMLFMAEYLNILFMSYLTIILFLNFYSMIFLCLSTLSVAIIILFIRASYPRLRYDLLMYLTWKIILPLALGGLIMINLLF